MRTRYLIVFATMALFLIDRFKLILGLQGLSIFLSRNFIMCFPRIYFVFPICLLIISDRCYLAGLITEAKFFIIYAFSFFSGLSFALIIFSKPMLQAQIFITFFFALVGFGRLFDIDMAPTIEILELVHNWAEIMFFMLIARLYLVGGAYTHSHQYLLIFFSILSGSKFLFLNQIVMATVKRYYAPVILGIVIFSLIINPLGKLDTRLSLYGLFFNNINWGNFVFNKIPSVNDLVYLETTIYSFHSIWLDYLWLGGGFGILTILVHGWILVTAYSREKSQLNKSIIIMYLICVTFGFSLFFGTKYMMLMLGILVFRMEISNMSLNWKSEQK